MCKGFPIKSGSSYAFLSELLNILQCVVALFAGANLYNIFNIVNKYLTVADVKAPFWRLL